MIYFPVIIILPIKLTWGKRRIYEKRFRKENEFFTTSSFNDWNIR